MTHELERVSRSRIPLPDDVAGVLEDLSDLAPDTDGGVWLLSDQSRRLAPLVLPLVVGEPVTIGRALDLPHQIGKPEGLAVQPDGLVAVPDDRDDDRDNLWIFRR